MPSIDDTIQDLKAAIVAENDAYDEYMRLSAAHTAAQKVWHAAKKQLDLVQDRLYNDVYKSVGILTPQQKYEQEKSA